MGILNLFSKKKDKNPPKFVPNRCDECKGPIHANGMPYYQCPSCGKNICNPCALRAGRTHNSATVACPYCRIDIRSGRTY